jgi:hypothetical protein
MNRYDDLAPLPVNALLFDQGTDVRRTLTGIVAGVVAHDGALGALLAQPRVDPDTVSSGIVQAVSTTLARSGPELMLDGLATVRDLLRAGRETSQDLDLTVVVPLGSHRIDRRETQTLQISVGPVTTSLTCQLDISFDVEPVNATVARGRLVRLGDARCHITGSFSIANREVGQGGGTINLATHLPLGPGLLLVPAARRSRPDGASRRQIGRSADTVASGARSCL